MSKASDSFTREHLRALLPKDWCVYTESLGYERCVVEDKTHPLVSVMLMGQGHTFPLQTLLFFALAEATRVLLKVRGKVSVYGDDIIVPTQMATQLITILTDLGFILNRDKSFFDAPDKIWRSKKFFRESCGADFYGGVDVRPFMPQGRSERLKAGRYTAFLHTMINGLYERWTDLEVPRTLELLYGELVRVNGFIAVVPDYETETAGVKHEPVLFTSFLVRPRVDTNTWLTTYCRLSLTTMKRRRGTDERIYYWRALWLGTRSDDIEYYEDDDSLSDTSFTLPENIRGLDPWYVFAR